MCELAVQPGDVLLAGSDGLWDNCYDEELLALLPASPEAAEQARASAGCARLKARHYGRLRMLPKPPDGSLTSK